MSAGSTIFWLGVGVVGVALLAPSLRTEAPTPADPAKPVAAAAAPFAPGQAGNGMARREIVRSGDGHFYLDAQVNGARITFLVDTGASMVALTAADAQRAGISLPSARAMARSAAGEVEIVPVTIDRIAVGPLEARGVEGAIVRQLEVSLLGQSFLARVGTVEISGDTMVLR